MCSKKTNVATQKEPYTCLCAWQEGLQTGQQKLKREPITKYTIILKSCWKSNLVLSSVLSTHSRDHRNIIEPTSYIKHNIFCHSNVEPLSLCTVCVDSISMHSFGSWIGNPHGSSWSAERPILAQPFPSSRGSSSSRRHPTKMTKSPTTPGRKIISRGCTKD